jgi:polyisoprenoid-binding protein YceI
MTSPQPSEGDLSAFSGSWTLDSSQSSLSFNTKAVWVLPVKGTLNPIEGSATVGTDGLISGSVVFDAASIDTKNKKRDDHLRTADFFEVEKYPTITFAVSNAVLRSGGEVELSGTLTIRNEARPLTLLAEVNVTNDAAEFTAETDIDRSAWGMTWAKMGAGLKNHAIIKARFIKS